MGIKRILEITLFLYLTIFLTTRFGTLIHEILGHGLASILMGGNLTGVSIHLFTAGSCSYQLLDPGLPQEVVVELAGIALNLVSGVICLTLLERLKLSWEITIILCVFAMVSIGSQLTYLVMGAYYGYGDPLIFEELLGSMNWLVWVLSLILIAPAAYFLAGSFLRLQEKMFPCDSLKARANILFLTFIAASVIYSACFYAEDHNIGFLGGMGESERVITEIAKQAVEGQFLTEQERVKQIEAIKEELRPFPIIVPLFLIALFSGLVAFLKTNDRPPPSVRYHFRVGYLWRSLFVSLVVAGMIVGV